MKFIFKNFLMILCFSWVVIGCGTSLRISDIPINEISKDKIKKELDTFSLKEKALKEILADGKLSTHEKIKKIADEGTIRDIVTLLWLLRDGEEEDLIPQKPSCLHSARQIFNAYNKNKQLASFECVEAAMLAAAILREKGIDAYLMYMTGINLGAGHTVCVYRTRLGWATIGIGNHDSMRPVFLTEHFAISINEIFRIATRERWFTRNIMTYALRRLDEVHEDFINGGTKYLFWSNVNILFSGRSF
ncbi:hypothetical protein [Candidatus Uabimicrobium sp. HlEnr_7]|uniref:hypothetical protein n=1 Tax=Candidatus Uabimicrobium helgolandensis TaxID=3095367 RepID=UPI003556F760